MAIAKMPKWTDEVANKDEMYANFWIGTAMVKTQEYSKRSEVYASRHCMSFKEFEQKVLSSKKENLHEWDDYVVWKGIEEARAIWSTRYKELCKCEA